MLILRLSLFAVYAGLLGTAWWFGIILLPAAFYMAGKSTARRPLLFLITAFLPTAWRRWIHRHQMRIMRAIRAWWGRRNLFSKTFVIVVALTLTVIWILDVFKVITLFPAFLPLPLLATVAVARPIRELFLQQVSNETLGRSAWEYLPKHAQSWVWRHVKAAPARRIISVRYKASRISKRLRVRLARAVLRPHIGRRKQLAS